MFVLGHLGIGKRLAAHPYRRFSRGSKRAFFVGALLPDLIDKPLYYGWSWLTGRHGAEAGLISGTHLFGHTGLFLLAVAAAAVVTHRPAARALAIGVATHLALDFVGLSMDLRTLLWPALGWHFPSYPFGSLTEHLGTMFRPVTFAGEVVGGAILLWDYRTSRPASLPAD